MKYAILFITLFFFSCYDQPKGERVQGNGYQIVVVDNCEYIEVKSMIGTDMGYYSLTHKGNCKFCIERSNTTK
jgi:hypothetical protein